MNEIVSVFSEESNRKELKITNEVAVWLGSNTSDFNQFKKKFEGLQLAKSD